MTRRLKERRGTGPDSLPAAGGKNQRAKSSGARRKRFFWAGSLVLIAGIVVYGLFVTDLLGGPRAAGEPAPDITLNSLIYQPPSADFSSVVELVSKGRPG